jgi:ABC-type proline/glycine betaine transport system substrate-binding protein
MTEHSGARTRPAWGEGLALLVLLALAAGALSACSAESSPSGSSSTPAAGTQQPAQPGLTDEEFTHKVTTALNASDYGTHVHDAAGDKSGTVFLTLRATTEDLGSKVNAEDYAQTLADFVFAKVPEVTTVFVSDGNKQDIGTYDRPK